MQKSIKQKNAESSQTLYDANSPHLVSFTEYCRKTDPD